MLAVHVGAVVDFPNHDRVFHNVFSFKDGKRFDPGMYPVAWCARSPSIGQDSAESSANIHPNMAAYVMAVDSSYFAVSGSDGTFTIADVDPGTYRYHAWRPGGDELAGEWATGSGLLHVVWP